MKNLNELYVERRSALLEILRRGFVIISLTAVFVSLLLALDIGWSSSRREAVSQNIQMNTLIFCAIAVVGSLLTGLFQRKIDEELDRVLFKANELSLSVVTNQTTLSCHKCYYFSQNSFLKCAVHPITVNTGESVDCVDFKPCGDFPHM